MHQDCRKHSKLIRKPTIISLLLLLVAISLDVAAQDTLSRVQASFIRYVAPGEDASLIRLSDDEFLEQAGRVVFRVNRYDVLTNDSLLHQLENEIIPVVNRDSMCLVRLILRGAASPEGPYDNNVMLSKRRARMLSDFLRHRLTVPVYESSYSVETIAEDYYLLLTMMRRADDPDYAFVRRFVDFYVPRGELALLKHRLKMQRKGTLWRRLLRQYFPDLRAARLVLVFERPFALDSVRAVPLTVPDETLAIDRPELLLSYQQPRRELLSLKTNLLFDFAYMPFSYNRWCPIPNVALEYYPLHGHFTFGASVDFPWWQHYDAHKYFQVRNYQLEGRYYFRSGGIEHHLPGQGAAFRGFYVQAYAHAGLFCLCMNADKGWIGEGYGGGVGIGYMLPISKKGHWRLEFGAQFGFFRAQHDPFQYEYRGSVDLQDHLYYYDWTLPSAQFKKRQYRFNWIGPTRIGISLTYDLLYRRIEKRGVSMKAYETVERRYE